jgi:DNA-repair protein complementing XP-A cells
MTDTKGGFLSSVDDPHNRAMKAPDDEQKPANMTMKEWERNQLLKKLRASKSGKFEPSISALRGEDQKKCRECGNLEIDWTWDEIFGTQVCSGCKEKFPDKYSLLTKTEAREDYLLTNPELEDRDLLPHLKRPNPHKSHWNDMQLFLRYQVEEYAFSAAKWGSPEALDAEFERREKDKKERKEKKFNTKLAELKKRTLVDAHRRKMKGLDGGDARFGDKIVGFNEKHEHEWGASVDDPQTGMSKKSCVICGMEVEELEL